MRVKCVICDQIESIDDNSLKAKKLRNRPIYTFMCKECDTRIADRTNERIATGNFKFHHCKEEEDTW